MMSMPKCIKRTSSLALVSILIGSVVGCGGGGGGENGGSSPPSSSYAGIAYSLIQDVCSGVGAIAPGHRSAQTAETTAGQRCQAEASRLAAESGSLAHICESLWTNECAAIYGGINNTGQCTVSGAHGNSTGAARSNALRDCQNTLGSGAECEIIVAGCASSATPLSGVWRQRSGPGQSGRYFNAVAGSMRRGSCNVNYYGSIVFNHSNSASADAEAIRLCQQEGGRECRIHRRFGSYYSNDRNCTALVQVVQSGFGFTSCSFTSEFGNTAFEAEQKSLAKCREFESSGTSVTCRIVQGARGSGGRGPISGCER